MGFLQVIITVYETAHHKKPAGSIGMAIHGIRVADGFKPILWFKLVPSVDTLDDVKVAVRELQKNLVGGAAAVLMATGDPQPDV